MIRANTNGYMQTGVVAGTPGTNWTIDAEKVRKSSEGWVSFGLTLSTTAAGSLTCYTLPSGFRPTTATIYVNGFYYDSSASLYYPLLCTITTAGEVGIYQVGGFVGVLIPATGDFVYIPNVIFWNG